MKCTVATICHRKWDAQDLTITADNAGVMPTLIARNLSSSSHQRLQALEDSGSPAYLPWHGQLTCICPSICHKVSAACPDCYCLSAVLPTLILLSVDYLSSLLQFAFSLRLCCWPTEHWSELLLPTKPPSHGLCSSSTIVLQCLFSVLAPQ